MRCEPNDTMPPDSTWLSSRKTIGHWKAIKPNLVEAESAVWNEVLDDFYFDRLKTRYLDPIEAVKNLKKSAEDEKPKGEGFAMVAIQCSLIEFLESCYQGINYDHNGANSWLFPKWLKRCCLGADSSSLPTY